MGMVGLLYPTRALLADALRQLIEATIALDDAFDHAKRSVRSAGPVRLVIEGVA